MYCIIFNFHQWSISTKNTSIIHGAFQILILSLWLLMCVFSFVLFVDDVQDLYYMYHSLHRSTSLKYYTRTSYLISSRKYKKCVDIKKLLHGCIHIPIYAPDNQIKKHTLIYIREVHHHVGTIIMVVYYCPPRVHVLLLSYFISIPYIYSVFLFHLCSAARINYRSSPTVCVGVIDRYRSTYTRLRTLLY